MNKDKKFKKAVNKLLKPFNPELIEVENNYTYTHKIETKAGTLFLKFGYSEASNLYSIFSRFQNVDLAYSVLSNHYNLNKFSGKFNFYHFDQKSILTLFDYEMKKIFKF